MSRRNFPYIKQISRSIASLLSVFALLICSNCTCKVAAHDSNTSSSPCHHEESESRSSSPPPSSEVSKCCIGRVASVEKSFYYQKDTHKGDPLLWLPTTAAQFDEGVPLTSKISSSLSSLPRVTISNRLFSISAPRGPPVVNL